MMHALIRAILLLFPVLAPVLAGQDIAEAARALAAQVAPHVPAGTAVRVTAKNVSSLGSGEFSRAQAALDRALRRRTPKQAPVAEVKLTVSENRREFLLVAEIVTDAGRAVEMTRYVREVAVATTLPAIEKRLLWEQETAILDLAMAGERMLLLDTSKLTVLERREGRWAPVDRAPLNTPPVRDPRGKLQVKDGNVDVFVPGTTCRSSMGPPIQLKCEAASAFELGGEQVRFTPGRNTLEWNGRPGSYSLAQTASQGKPMALVAETDGRTHLYDAERRRVAVIEEWGSELAAVCGGRVLATLRGSDQVRAYALVEQKMAEATEPLDLPGPVTAMWPMGGGAMAVVWNPVSGRYAAYSLSVDCGH